VVINKRRQGFVYERKKVEGKLARYEKFAEKRKTLPHL
jgi:hypothetical protein